MASGTSSSGIAAQALGDALGLIALVTGLFAATARYAGVLFGRDQSQVERLTGFGFFTGLCLSLAAVVAA